MVKRASLLATPRKASVDTKAGNSVPGALITNAPGENAGLKPVFMPHLKAAQAPINVLKP